MPSPDEVGQRRYSVVAIALHWLIAALIVTNFLIGLRFDELKGLQLFALLQWHKSFGITVLVLSLLRLAWRLAHPAPPYPAHMPAWEKAAARAAHWGFYLLMIAIPLTGWIVVSASPTNIPTLLYKTIPWPHIGWVHGLPLPERKSLGHTVVEVHGTLAWGAAILLAIHVLAALRHQFLARDEVLWRMLPVVWLKPRRPADS
jgi:cytochrome b561